MASLKNQARQTWELKQLAALKKSGRMGAQAVGYIAERNVRLGFAKQTTGAKWTLQGMLFGLPVIQVNASQEKALKSGRDAWSLSLIAHEAKHYQQGLLVALSVYGELEAWQLQMQVLRDLGAPPSHPALLAIEKLPLSHDPKVLREAARLMKQYSSPYRIDLLPLNPVGYQLWQALLARLSALLGRRARG
jgi:hypothetical protein